MTWHTPDDEEMQKALAASADPQVTYYVLGTHRLVFLRDSDPPVSGFLGHDRFAARFTRRPYELRAATLEDFRTFGVDPTGLLK